MQAKNFFRKLTEKGCQTMSYVRNLQQFPGSELRLDIIRFDRFIKLQKRSTLLGDI